MWQVVCPDPFSTQALGAALGASAHPGTVVALSGDLGAGKTCFGQGVGDGLGITDDIVSPTFVLVAEYDGRLPLLHADVYRLEAGELEGIGLEESLEAWPGLALVEWADRFPQVLPLDHLAVRIDIEGERRRLTIQASGPRSGEALQRWRAAHEG